MITQTEGYWERIARIKEEMLKVAYAENKALKLKEQAYLVWQDKTDWIQDTAKVHELGMHRADVLKRRIEELQVQFKAPEQEPVAWRDHVEQRLLTWRQSFINRSGDQLALDDFMDKRSLDDLIEFVCDENGDTHGEELYCMGIDDIVDTIKPVDAKATAREREACAKVCEQQETYGPLCETSWDCATAIRNRGDL